MTTLGKKIALYRKQNNYTQEGLANKLNISAQAVSKWENDLSIPDLPLLIELSNLFNISIDKLVKDEDTPTSYYVPEEKRKPIEELILKISVLSSDGDKVKVNLPLIIIKACIEAGMPITASKNENEALKNIDFNHIFNLIEQGVIGTLLEIESEDGDYITITVE